MFNFISFLKNDATKSEDVRESILRKKLEQETDQILRQSILEELKEIYSVI